MEELDHDVVLDGQGKVVGDKKQDGHTPQQEPRVNMLGGSRRKVASWAGLFQDDEEARKMGRSEIAEYSCIRLLREMEALEQEEEEDEMQPMDQDDNELVTLHLNWCEKIADNMNVDGLPENLYNIPEVDAGQQVGKGTEGEDDGT
jgi:hypothetical protein